MPALVLGDGDARGDLALDQRPEAERLVQGPRRSVGRARGHRDRLVAEHRCDEQPRQAAPHVAGVDHEPVDVAPACLGRDAHRRHHPTLCSDHPPLERSGAQVVERLVQRGDAIEADEVGFASIGVDLQPVHLRRQLMIGQVDRLDHRLGTPRAHVVSIAGSGSRSRGRLHPGRSNRLRPMAASIVSPVATVSSRRPNRSASRPCTSALSG